jgi:elongator complex protein 3
MVKHVFQGNDLQLDYCKIYPCLDLPFTEIRRWKHAGKWVSIAETRFPEFLDFLCYTMSIVPPWTRINRVQRDFPEATVKNNQLGYVSDTIRSNLQQIVTQTMVKKGIKCFDIRSREVRNSIIDTELYRAKLYVRTYRANDGTEFFISVEIPKNTNFNDTHLLGLCRLRIPDFEFSDKENIPFNYLPVYRNKIDRIARIREVHVYGNIASISKTGNSQHRGIGKFLVSVAETIALGYSCTLMTIISGVGVRDYYENIGYELDRKEDQYMVRDLRDKETSLFLFDKKYDAKKIRDVIKSSIISRRYIKNIKDTNKPNSEHFIYKDIQGGEAEGFCFSGESKKISTQLIVIFICALIMFVAYNNL